MEDVKGLQDKMDRSGVGVSLQASTLGIFVAFSILLDTTVLLTNIVFRFIGSFT
jgi:hypothetical protein